MAYDDALFQLGMDLTRSSTAQKEDHGCSARVAPVERKDFFEREGVRFAGTHLIIDLYGACKLDDPSHIERMLRRCIEAAGGTLLHFHLHRFSRDDGQSAVAGVAVLADSRISIHCWPEAEYAALDVLLCGNSSPHLVPEVLRQAFDAREMRVREQKRGDDIEAIHRRVAAAKKDRSAKGKSRIRKAA